MLRRKLLVVEDDDTCRERMGRILRHLNYEVTSAATVSEGLAALDPPPHCILLDLSLPDGSGEAILEKIRADHLTSRVVVCTGECDEARLTKVREMGATAVLIKPVVLSELVTACRISPRPRGGV